MMKVFALLGLALSIVAGPAAAKQEKEPYKEDPRVKAAVARALEFLAKSQEPSGAWRMKVGKFLMQRELGQADDHVGVTALALLAFMGDGHLPDRGKYAEVVAKGLEYIMGCVQETGYVSSNGTNMYTHGFAVLCLAEIYGMTKREDVEKALKRAVELTQRCQNAEGGWRYNPAPSDADLSITVCQIQALRAARNKGIAVKKSVIDKALEYVKGCELSQGGFSYQRQNPRKITPLGSSSAGLVSYYSLGYFDEQAHERHFKYLMSFCDDGGNLKTKGVNHFFYSHYYTVQAMYQKGGDYWKTYWNLISNYLVANQNGDGWWRDDVGPPFAAAMGCIILQVPKEILPILQK